MPSDNDNNDGHRKLTLWGQTRETRSGLSGCAGPWGPSAWYPHRPLAVGLLPTLRSPPGEGARAAPTLFCCPRHQAKCSLYRGNQTPYPAIRGPTRATAPPAGDQHPGTVFSPSQAEWQPRRSPAGPGVLTQKEWARGVGQMPHALHSSPGARLHTHPQGAGFHYQAHSSTRELPNYVSCLWWE